MNSVSNKKYTRISIKLSKLCSEKSIELSNKLKEETKIWCKNPQLSQQFFDAICYLGSLNHNSEIIYDRNNALQYIDLDPPCEIKSLAGLSLIFEILSGSKDIFDYSKLEHHASIGRGESYVKGTKIIPPIKLDEVSKYKAYRDEILNLLESKLANEEPKTNLRLKIPLE